MQTQPNSLNSSTGGITEIVLANPDVDYETLVYPMLAHLSRNSGNKWFTWISNNARREKPALNKFDFARTNVRMVNSQDKQNGLWLLWDALAHGNSATVVASFSHLTEAERTKLEMASHVGGTRGIILIHRH